MSEHITIDRKTWALAVNALDLDDPARARLLELAPPGWFVDIDEPDDDTPYEEVPQGRDQLCPLGHDWDPANARALADVLRRAIGPGSPYEHTIAEAESLARLSRFQRKGARRG